MWLSWNRTILCTEQWVMGVLVHYKSQYDSVSVGRNAMHIEGQPDLTAQLCKYTNQLPTQIWKQLIYN